MDRRSLRVELERKRINPDAYCLDGAVRDNAYVLKSSAGKWITFFSERGTRSSERLFDTEDEACRHLLSLVLRDHVLHPEGEPEG